MASFLESDMDFGLPRHQLKQAEKSFFQSFSELHPFAISRRRQLLTDVQPVSLKNSLFVS